MKSLVLLAGLLLSDRPELVNGRLEEMGASRGLSADFESLARRAGSVSWGAYVVSRVEGTHSTCGDSGVVRLDGDGGFESSPSEDRNAALLLLYRLENGKVTRVRAVSTNCRIDASGRTLHFFEGVSSAQSLSFLGSLAPGDDVVHAIALHRDERADEILDGLARTGSSLDVRKRAVFWLGAARGVAGFRRLASLSDAITDPKLSEHIVFAIHLSPAEGATPKLIQIARTNRAADVREHALFWLAQRAGERAARAIVDAANDDPELDVKKKAVFALSQLPEDEGVPLLVELAETHRNPEVRKQAFFWLGQSDDPRALALFERVLLKKD